MHSLMVCLLRDLQMAIQMYRDLLLKKNIQSITSIRQVLLKKFAECLMFNVASSQYAILRDPTNNDKYKWVLIVYIFPN